MNFLRPFPKFSRKPLRPLLASLASVCLLVGCARHDPSHTQGYVEGEYIRAAAPSGGQLKHLFVERGNEIKKDAPLYALDDSTATSARDEAAHQVAQAAAALDDAKQGARPTAIDALSAQLAEARASLAFAEQEFTRQQTLRESGANTARDLDSARATRDAALQQVTRIEANLADARLGARSAQIAAAQETLLARKAALAHAEWTLAQTTQNAPTDALVADTLYRPGDWVAAGAPVVLLLPPGQIKVRTFVAQSMLGRLQVGAPASVSIDGVAGALPARITWIAPRAEYAPPVIYSQEMREKFVYLVELSLAPQDAARLHVGQPVDVDFATSESR